MSECMNKSSTTQITAAFATGALIGAAVTLLFAPQSGRQTREMMANKSHDLKDAAGDAIERGKTLVNDVKRDTHEAFEKGKKVAHEASAA